MGKPREWPMRGLAERVFCATLEDMRTELAKAKGGTSFLQLVESQPWPDEGMWLVPWTPSNLNTKTRP